MGIANLCINFEYSHIVIHGTLHTDTGSIYHMYEAELLDFFQIQREAPRLLPILPPWKKLWELYVVPEHNSEAAPKATQPECRVPQPDLSSRKQ